MKEALFAFLVALNVVDEPVLYQAESPTAHGREIRRVHVVRRTDEDGVSKFRDFVEDEGK